MSTQAVHNSLFAALLTVLLLPAVHAFASDGDDPHAKHRAMMKQASTEAQSAGDIELRDELLVTQLGNEVRFASDVIGEEIIVMDFVYTTCTTVCPVLSAILQQVQTGLGERVGSDVRLVSISVDPTRDTPERLKAYADSLRADASWLWLTGEKTNVDEVLRGLGTYTPNFEDHPSIVMVGDAKTGTWKRFFGFPGPKKILAAVDELTAARNAADAGS